MDDEHRDDADRCRLDGTDRGHLDGIDDGCGCAEVWEHTSDRRREE